jgi:signal transduction histidine kinase
MRLQFRHRISLLVALAMTALLAVTAGTLVLGRRAEQQLTGIETRYVPLIELDADLDRMFTQTTRALEDAAGAGEEAKIAEADALAAEFTKRLTAGAHVVRDNGGDPDAVGTAFRSYYSVAREVSDALAKGAPFGPLAEKIEEMRRAQRNAAAILDLSTSPNRLKLALAFATARDSARTTLWVDLVVAAVAFALMAFVSWRIIRRTVGSLQAVSQGVERLARGELANIEVLFDDEFGDLAREANRTSRQLRDARQRVETANKELEAFSYSVSHDLRAPLRAVDGFSRALEEDDADRLSPEGKEHLRRIRKGAQRMGELIEDLLRLSRVSRGEFQKTTVDLAPIARAIVAELRNASPEREIRVTIPETLSAFADARLIRVLLENLLGNAWKFSAKAPAAEIELGKREDEYFVRDNGAGFDMKEAERLFGAFQRLHTDKEFPGTGIGLATVQRIISRHGGAIRAEAEIGRGATFSFTLPEA